MVRAGFAAAVLAAALSTPLAAQPASHQCDYKGQGRLGPLQIDFDALNRSVTVKTHDGQIWKYKDGVTARITPAAAQDDLGPVEQFVKVISPNRVEVGFRWPDDNTIGHMAYFDPESFTNPAKRCLWKSLWDFAMG